MSDQTKKAAAPKDAKKDDKAAKKDEKDAGLAPEELVSIEEHYYP